MTMRVLTQHVFSKGTDGGTVLAAIGPLVCDIKKVKPALALWSTAYMGVREL
jgi:hypothetical protein